MQGGHFVDDDVVAPIQSQGGDRPARKAGQLHQLAGRGEPDSTRPEMGGQAFEIELGPGRDHRQDRSVRADRNQRLEDLICGKAELVGHGFGRELFVVQVVLADFALHACLSEAPDGVGPRTGHPSRERIASM